MRNLLLLLFFCLPVLAQAQQRLTLDKAIEISLENNFQLREAENNLSLSRAQVRSAQAEFLPSLNASLNGNQNVGRQFVQEDASFTDRTTYNVSGGISTNLAIFGGFENINNLRRSRTNYRREEADRTRIRESIIFNTAMRYLQLLLDRELLDIAEQNLETSKVQLRQVEAQVEVGSRPTVDLYQQQSVVASNELQVVQAENALSVSRTQLIRVLQLDPLEEVQFEAPEIDESKMLPQDLNLEEMISIALSSRSDVQSQRLSINASRYSLAVARAAYYPSLNASVNFNTRYSDQYSVNNQSVAFGDQFFEQMISRSVGFSISIPIFNRMNTRTNVEQAKVQYRNARLALEDIRYEVREEIGQAYNDYISLVKEIDATEKALLAAERAYETQQERYEIGAASLIELNQATANYMEAMSNREQVLYNFLFQEKLLDYYLGRLAEEQGA
ncbi:MAG: TolC family protein [Balneolaceae bacterium]